MEGGDQFRFLTRRFAEPKEVHLIYNADHRLRGNEDKITEKATLSFIAG
ncbi:MAG: hypothetical protein HY666_01810 [Chloroflexi bacterium]|nr:hypothetical protein [Chloroflexota bacterium]